VATAREHDRDRRHRPPEAAGGSPSGATIGALELLHVYVGDRLRLCSALTEQRDAPVRELQEVGTIESRRAIEHTFP